jgi:hypothetical protein
MELWNGVKVMSYIQTYQKEKEKVMSYIQTNNQREKGIFYWDKKNVKHVRCLVGSLSHRKKSKLLG